VAHGAGECGICGVFHNNVKQSGLRYFGNLCVIILRGVVMQKKDKIERVVDGFIRRCHWVMAAGFIIWTADIWLDLNVGALGFTAIWLGACGGACQEWRRERGIWMLSGFFLAITAVIGAGLGYFAVRDMSGHRPGILAAAGFGMAGVLLLMQMLFLTGITYLNFRRRRSMD